MTDALPGARPRRRWQRVLSALPGAILGVPLGIGLFKVVAGQGIVPASPTVARCHSAGWSFVAALQAKCPLVVAGDERINE